MRLQGKVAIVTGGGAGMGFAVACAYAREGARVVIAEINDDDGAAAVNAIRTGGGEAIFCRTDVAEAQSVAAMAAQAVAQWGTVDILYNNAAVQLVGQDARAHELSEEVWDRTYSVNIRGLWLCAKYVIPILLERGGGSIINVASPTGLVGCAPGFTAYSSSKGAVYGLTRVMAADYARDRIRVNALVPGPIATPLTKELFSDPATREGLINAVPLGRIGQPEDVVGLALFLASDESAYCTGGSYMVDGGQTAI
ncbi:MAG TPA: glucose 1-dehydrogenase [Caldilineaceae bacterium]|nr:glucose 1-dehydrogenase [Caldilineaceae bacterium]